MLQLLQRVYPYGYNKNIHNREAIQMTFQQFTKTTEGQKAAKSWAKLAIKMNWSNEELEQRMRVTYKNLAKAGLM